MHFLTQRAPLLYSTQILLQQVMCAPSKEARLLLAIRALEDNEDLSIWAIAKLYNVLEATIRHQRNGQRAQRDIPANSRSLTDLEEQTIVQYTIELSAHAFPPRLRGVEDMANYLQRERDAPPIGQR